MRKPVVECVYDHALATPEKIAVICSGVETSYGQLFRLVRGYSCFLKNEGVKKGDIIVTKASQNLDYAVIYLGIHLCGGVVASLERNVADEGFLKVVNKLSASFMLTDSIYPEIPGVKTIQRKDALEKAAAWADREEATLVFPQLEDSADILFTTGTTGESKGVELSHRALAATAENLIYGCGYKKDTVMILPGPLNHANAIRKLFTTIINGSTICILNGMMSVKRFFDALDNPNGSIACCLPPAAIRTIFQTTKDKLGEYAYRIDFIESATAPLPEPDKLKLCQLLPNTRLYNNYGSSESASVCMYDYNANPGLTGCIGKAMPNSQIIVVDDDKKEMVSSAQHMGLLACKGDVNMTGYVNDPEATAQVLVDGIVYTNDIGYIDADGFIYISGRKGDVINVGGLKVAPTEVESATLAFPGVDDCICIGVDDPISGKALKLLVVMAVDQQMDIRALRTFLMGKLENYKVPMQYEQVDKVARTFNGKLDRKAYAK